MALVTPKTQGISESSIWALLFIYVSRTHVLQGHNFLTHSQKNLGAADDSDTKRARRLPSGSVGSESQQESFLHLSSTASSRTRPINHDSQVQIGQTKETCSQMDRLGQVDRSHSVTRSERERYEKHMDIFWQRSRWIRKDCITRSRGLSVGIFRISESKRLPSGAITPSESLNHSSSPNGSDSRGGSNSSRKDEIGGPFSIACINGQVSFMKIAIST